MKSPSRSLGLLGALLLGAPGLRADPPPTVPAAEKLGLTFANEIVLSSDTELKAGDSKYQHVSFVHASWGLSQVVPTGQAGAFTFGLAYNISAYRVTEPSNWEDDDEWEEYKRTHPDWKHIPLPRQLQSLSASIEYSREVNERWSLSASVSAGSHVAGKKLLSNGWGATASLMGLYKWSDRVTVAVGAAYDSLSHDYRFVPLIGIDWQFNEKWSAAIGFPSTAVTYALRKDLTLAIEASGAGGTFLVQEEPTPGLTGRTLVGSKLESTEVRLGFKTAWQINDTFSISASTGHVLYREYKYIDRDYRLKSRDVSGFGAISGSISF